MSIDFSLLGSALKERREALGIPRAEIARRVGVTATYIWLVEGARPRKSGQPSRPTQAVLERWARALGMDDRYARQLLIMAGYVAPTEEQRSEARTIAALPRFSRSARTMQTQIPATGQEADIERPRAAAPAPHLDEALTPTATPAAFAAAPVHFDQPPDLRSEVLLDDLRQVLRLAQSSPERWEDTARLVESFLAWLRYRLEHEG